MRTRFIARVIDQAARLAYSLACHSRNIFSAFPGKLILRTDGKGRGGTLAALPIASASLFCLARCPRQRIREIRKRVGVYAANRWRSRLVWLGGGVPWPLAIPSLFR